MSRTAPEARGSLGPAFFAGVALAACHGGDKPAAPEPVTVSCEAPTPLAVEDLVPLRGRVQPPPGGDLPVASQVAGRVATVVAHEGDAIAAGDVVATLDDANSKDSLRQAEAAAAQAQAAAANASLTLERTKALVARGIAAKQELEDAAAKEAEAKANLVASSAAADVARRTLGRVAVRSSFAGIVTKVWRGAGALVDGTAATPIVQLAASAGLEFSADATGDELARVHEGNDVRGTLASGGAFEGKVRARARALDSSTGLGTIRVAISSVDGGAPLGSFGRGVVVVARREGVLTLPGMALRGAVADGAEVVVCAGGKATIRKVQVGWRGNDRFEVASGVAANETVAVDHVLGLSDGTPIVGAKSVEPK